MVRREITIEAPCSLVFDVIRRFEDYPKFLNTTKSAKERKVKKAILVDFSIDVVRSISYTLEFEIAAPYLIRWDLVKGDLMKKNSGSWELISVSEAKTKAKYTIDVDFGWMVPKMIVDQLTKFQLPEMLDTFKARIEEIYSKKRTSLSV